MRSTRIIFVRNNQQGEYYKKCQVVLYQVVLYCFVVFVRASYAIIPFHSCLIWISSLNRQTIKWTGDGEQSRHILSHWNPFPMDLLVRTYAFQPWTYHRLICSHLCSYCLSHFFSDLSYFRHRPSFVAGAAVADSDQQQRAIVNTILALSASTIAAFWMSSFLSSNKRFRPVDIQNATLAGIGTAATPSPATSISSVNVYANQLTLLPTELLTLRRGGHRLYCQLSTQSLRCNHDRIYCRWGIFPENSIYHNIWWFCDFFYQGDPIDKITLLDLAAFLLNIALI